MVSLLRYRAVIIRISLCYICDILVVYESSGSEGDSANAMPPAIDMKAYEDLAIRLSKSTRMMWYLRVSLGKREQGGLFDSLALAYDFCSALHLVCETQGQMNVIVQNKRIESAL